MSGFNYQNNNKYQGWNNPSNIFSGPQISSLSSYYSPSGSTSLVSISGSNFSSFSTIKFGTYTPTVYFITSKNLQFYVPSTLNSGIFPIQVFNGSTGSNVVNYTIDNASGYWILNNSGTITNTNTSNSSLVSMSSISRGVPITINNPSPTSPYVVPNNINWIICNTTTGFVYIKLPLGQPYIGREITLKNPTGTNTVLTSSDNQNIIIPLNKFNNEPTNQILPAKSASWCTLVYNGTYWITMQGNV